MLPPALAVNVVAFHEFMSVVQCVRIDYLGKIDKLATRTVLFSTLNCIFCIKKLTLYNNPSRELPTLIYRRSRGDMIETYKLLSGKYDSQVALKLSLYLSDDHHMRGNSRKLLVKR